MLRESFGFLDNLFELFAKSLPIITRILVHDSQWLNKQT